jgi:hypothetical protein
MNVTPLGDGSVLYSEARGAMQVHHLGRGVSLHVRRGVIPPSFAKPVMEDGEGHLRRVGRYVLMVDALEVVMHTTEFRDAMTDWFQKHETACVHMLIRSHMLEMAINVANLLMGQTRAKVYFDPSVWEAVGKAEAPSFARRSLVMPETRSTRAAP